jgi:competence protein ComEC
MNGIALFLIAVSWPWLAGRFGATRIVGSPANGDALTIEQFDVGQGDAALITTPDLKRILIDAGPNAYEVARILCSRGIKSIDLVMASHNHSDHIGGLPQVFAQFDVKAYMDNGVPHTTTIYRQTLNAVEREPHIRYLKASARTIDVGSVNLRILPPSGYNSSQNENSIGVVVEYGTFRELFTGDADNMELRRWLQRGLISKTSVVKVPHHGSRDASLQKFAMVTQPKIAVVSVGRRNAYGHPALKVVATWVNRGAQLYRTDIDGDILITVSKSGEFHVVKRARKIATRRNDLRSRSCRRLDTSPN